MIYFVRHLISRLFSIYWFFINGAQSKEKLHNRCSMSSTTLLVKNMVCHRCILAVEGILQNEKILFQKVSIGEIHLMAELSQDQKDSLAEKLNKIGFEIIDNYSGGLIEKIKQVVIKRARNEVDERKGKKSFRIISRKKLIMNTPT